MARSEAPGGANDDLKAKMREALERKKANDRGVPRDAPSREKVHGSEVSSAPAQRRYRPKAGES